MSVELIRLSPPIDLLPDLVDQPEGYHTIGQAIISGAVLREPLHPGTHHVEVPSIGHNHRFEVDVHDDETKATVWLTEDNPRNGKRKYISLPSDATERVVYGYHKDEQGNESVRATQ